LDGGESGLSAATEVVTNAKQRSDFKIFLKV
jgi:hypothetical protein